MKRWMVLFLTLCLAALLCLSAAADADNAELSWLDDEAQAYLTENATENGVFPRVVDIADLLTDDEEDDFAYTIAGIAEDNDFDVVILTVDGLGGKTPAAYADDFFDYGGYGYGYGRNGVLFMFNKGDRDWYVATTGYGETAFTDYGIDYIYNKIARYYLKDDQYADCFEACLDTTEDFLRAANNGTPYDTDHTYMGYETSTTLLGGKRELTAKKVLISFAVALVIAWTIVSMMKKSMKTVYMQPKAGTYVQDGSFILSQSSDTFLYSNVTRVPRQTSSSSGGGGGGKV